MGKMMKTGLKQAADRLNRNPASIHKVRNPESPGLVDSRSTIALQRQLMEGIDSSAAITLQRQQIQRSFGHPVQEQTSTDALIERAREGIVGPASQPPHLPTIQAAFGHHDLSGVTAHVGGAAAAVCDDLSANAYTLGGQVAFQRSPDLFTAAHEYAHCVQQRQGVRLQSNIGQRGDVHERHADAVAQAVVRGESAEALLDDAPGGGSNTTHTALQGLLGFELELLVFVDEWGHRIPEKTKLGSYGAHLTLDVDESNVGVVPEPAPETHWSIWSDNDDRYYYQNQSDPNDWTWDDPGGTRKETPAILELVTKPYAPENQSGQANIKAAIGEAVALARVLGDGKTRQPMHKLPSMTPDRESFNVGNSGGGRTDASIQTTFGIDIAQLGSLLESWANAESLRKPFRMKHHSDTEGKEVATDIEERYEGQRVDQELPLAVQNATTAINRLVDKLQQDGHIDADRVGYWKTHLNHLKGLAVVVCQYLRLGRYFWYPNKDPETGSVIVDQPWRKNLDKNVVAAMSRTDLSAIFQKLVPDAEKKTDTDAASVAKALAAILLEETNRTGNKNLFNDPTESFGAGKGMTDMPSCATFVDNVLTKGSDGVTAKFGAILTMGPEKVDTGQWKKTKTAPDYDVPNTEYYYHPDEPSQWERPETYKEGAVFELRNMIPRVAPRFPPSDWMKVAEYVTKSLELLNARGETEQGKVDPKRTW